MTPEEFQKFATVMMNDIEDLYFSWPADKEAGLKQLEYHFRLYHYQTCAIIAAKLYSAINNHRSHERNIEVLRQICHKNLIAKANEYAFNNDRLWNFKEASRITGERLEFMPWYFALKHLVSIFDICEGRLGREYADERFGDFFAYQILTEACRYEETKNTD